jgi:hypothetical protein
MGDFGHEAIVHTMRPQSSEQVGQSRTILDFVRNKRPVEIGPESNPILTKAMNQMVKVSKHYVKLKLGIHPSIGS